MYLSVCKCTPTHLDAVTLKKKHIAYSYTCTLIDENVLIYSCTHTLIYHLLKRENQSSIINCIQIISGQLRHFATYLSGALASTGTTTVTWALWVLSLMSVVSPDYSCKALWTVSGLERKMTIHMACYTQSRGSERQHKKAPSSPGPKQPQGQGVSKKNELRGLFTR